MRPPARAALSVPLLALALTSPAGAAGRTARAQAVASAVFRTRCEGTVVIRYGAPSATRLGVTAATARWRRRDRPGHPFDHCTIVLNRDVFGPGTHASYAFFCSVLLHEYGHLAGRRHSRNPASIMFPIVPIDRRCTAPAAAPAQ